MAQTPPTNVDALPAAPSTTVPSTFATLADAFVAALATFRTQINNIATNVYNNAVDAYNNAVAAAASAASALASQITASAAAVTAVNAPGTNATSTTSVLIGTGSKSFTIQTGKSIVPGMSLKIAYTTSPGNWLLGDVTSYDTATGALVINITATNGSGTYAVWTASLSSPLNYATLASQTKTANYTMVDGDVINWDTSAGVIIGTLPLNPALDAFVAGLDLPRKFNTNKLTIARNGQKIEGLAEDMDVTIPCAFTLKYTGATYGWKLI